MFESLAYTLSMPNEPEDDATSAIRKHLDNVAENLQLVADLGYGDVVLAVPDTAGILSVIADARPMTAIAAAAASRAGATLSVEDEPEAYEALKTGRATSGERRRTTRGISFATFAYPVGEQGGVPSAVIVRNVAEQVLEAPGAMETASMELAEEILRMLGDGPLLELDTSEPFSTTRRAGDGVLRISAEETIAYASPNAVNIMRLAGVEPSRGGKVAVLPGARSAIISVVGQKGMAVSTEIGSAGRVLGYRAIGVATGALVLVEDRTEARLREQELKVKEATIREVHHRVKNNLQTIASLLRIQGRRTENDEVRRALAEAMERVSSMAVVHELLAGSTEENIDFTEAASTVVDMVRRGLSGDASDIEVQVTGSTGLVPARVATSLALVVAELVHNAIEHGLDSEHSGDISVEMRRLPAELTLTVRDEGPGLPDDFDLATSPNLGLAIVHTIVEDDLRGTLSFGRGSGTTVTVRVPLGEEG